MKQSWLHKNAMTAGTIYRSQSKVLKFTQPQYQRLQLRFKVNYEYARLTKGGHTNLGGVYSLATRPGIVISRAFN
jgi:hypothetical protein